MYHAYFTNIANLNLFKKKVKNCARQKINNNTSNNQCWAVPIRDEKKRPGMDNKWLYYINLNSMPIFFSLSLSLTSHIISILQSPQDISTLWVYSVHCTCKFSHQPSIYHPPLYNSISLGHIISRQWAVCVQQFYLCELKSQQEREFFFLLCWMLDDVPTCKLSCILNLELQITDKRHVSFKFFALLELKCIKKPSHVIFRRHPKREKKREGERESKYIKYEHECFVFVMLYIIYAILYTLCSCIVFCCMYYVRILL